MSAITPVTTKVNNARSMNDIIPAELDVPVGVGAVGARTGDEIGALVRLLSVTFMSVVMFMSLVGASDSNIWVGSTTGETEGGSEAGIPVGSVTATGVPVGTSTATGAFVGSGTFTTVGAGTGA